MDLNMRILPIIIMFAFALTSCFEEEAMVAPHIQGDMEEGQAGLGSNYERQVFFDLNQNKEVRSNLVSEWDLSFESSSGGWIIRLNTSKFMYAGTSSDTTFSTELDLSSLDMRFDASHGDPDSTALRSWFLADGDSAESRKLVYLVDRGSDHQFNPVGLKKVQFDISGKDYILRFANNDNSQDSTVLISRDPSVNLLYYSFDAGMVDISPPSRTWSLLFTKYTTMLVTDEGENYPYLVMGVMLNPDGVRAALDNIHDFMEMELADTIDLELINQPDVIGYEWKYYNFDAGFYTIEPDMSYVIRDRDGFYYKLRFTDFYNDGGEKGYPKFEYVRL